ncbi:uncharacterized protein NEMAJ01_1613 [Nematocida major]|uniref:uncharacterized protein n=1 Tax=Nematocida major TaxID=1912982 RepID=UPI0020076D6F|nr:uncharacterized protein NEMAJ01_1613 [Nematocida major]KAH9386717.1 hypothetical protein NEMAJ01_1613 [Nematocida major]
MQKKRACAPRETAVDRFLRGLVGREVEVVIFTGEAYAGVLLEYNSRGSVLVQLPAEIKQNKQVLVRYSSIVYIAHKNKKK